MKFQDQMQSVGGPFITTAAAAGDNVTLTARDRAVRVACKAATNAKIMLPPASEYCAGSMVAIFCTAAASGGDYTVYLSDGSTAPVWAGTADALTADGDFLLAYCDGLKWYVVAEKTT